MKVVRRTRFGMVSRSRPMIASVSARVWRRFIILRMRSLMCWSGMSRYGITFSQVARASYSSSVK